MQQNRQKLWQPDEHKLAQKDVLTDSNTRVALFNPKKGFLPVPFEASWQLNVAHMLQQPQSFGTFRYQQNFCQALDQPNYRIPGFQGHDSAKDEPGKRNRRVVRMVELKRLDICNKKQNHVFFCVTTQTQLPADLFKPCRYINKQLKIFIEIKLLFS